jgi:ParB/RepB/Spo0J family partition protein
MAVMELRPDEVDFDPKNPRSEIGDVSDLVASIKTHGLIQPITVRRTDEGRFVVVAGNRRLAALKELKRSVSAIEVEFGTEKEYKEVSVAENIVRSQMTPVDEAKAVASLFRRGKGRMEVGAMFGKSARWAEARYRIAKLGGKAIEYLEKGIINLGHAEALTVCPEGDIDRFLDMAKWNTPEQLRNAILKSRKALDKACFDCKKVCEGCTKKSDCQQDLFGDIKDVYCLDEECFEANVKKFEEQLAESWKANGYERVPEGEDQYACNGWGEWTADTDDEDDKEHIEELKKNGVKPMFWVYDGKSGLAYREPEEEGEDGGNDGEDEDGLSWSDRNAIEHKVCAVDEPHVRAKVHDVVATLDDIQVAFVLATLTNCRYEYTECDADGNHTDKDESFLLHVGDEVGEKRQRDILEDEIVESVLGYSGVRNGDERGYFGCLPKDEAMQKAKELWESEKANEKETDDGED